MKYRSHTLLAVAFIVMCCFAVVSCRKESGTYGLKGVVRNGNTNQPIQSVNVKISKQTVSGGTFGGTFTTAATTTTDAGGNYELQWPRENFSALKVVAEKNQYITRSVNLNVDNFSPGETLTRDLTIYPEAFISVTILNNGETSAQDQLQFTFTNALFECDCCSNGWKTFSGANVDTTITCKVYGDREIKFQKRIITAAADTLIKDSIFCPSFQTTGVNIQY